MSYKQTISIHLYVRLRGTCSLTDPVFLNNGE